MVNQGKSIGALALAAGVGVETVRFYQRQGLLPEPAKDYGRIRRYGEPDVERLRFIKSAQRLGFTLVEVAGLLKLEDGAHCDEARQLAEQKLADARSKLADLRKVESALVGLVKNCCASQGALSCPLISTLQARPGAAAKGRRREAGAARSLPIASKNGSGDSEPGEKARRQAD